MGIRLWLQEPIESFVINPISWCFGEQKIVDFQSYAYIYCRPSGKTLDNSDLGSAWPIQWKRVVEQRYRKSPEPDRPATPPWSTSEAEGGTPGSPTWDMLDRPNEDELTRPIRGPYGM